MALQFGSLRDALEAAGAPTLAKVEGDPALLEWMVATNIALMLLVLVNQFGMLG